VNFGQEMMRVGFVAALLLPGSQIKGRRSESQCLLSFAGEQVNLATFDEHQRQATQPAHCLRTLDGRLDIRQPLGDAPATGMRNPQVDTDRRTQQRNLFARGNATSENGDRGFEFALADSRAAESETGMPNAVSMSGGIRHADASAAVLCAP
jgi:hypothetical protein